MASILDHLTVKKELFASARARGLTLDSAGAAAGVSPRTARRYSVDPAVAARVRALQDEALGDTTRRLQSGSWAMLEVLQSLAESKSESATVRLRAAVEWLALAFRATEILDLSVRLAELEERIAAND